MPASTRSFAPPASDRIRDLLARHIEKRWKDGDRLPAVDELARQMGVGQTNTYRAVQALAREGLVVSRPRLGTFVVGAAKRTSTPLGGVTQAATPRIYVPVYDTWDLMARRMLRGFEKEMAARHWPLITEAPEKRHDFSAVDADAIVLFQHGVTPSDQFAPHHSVIMVSTAGTVPAHATNRYDSVTVDHVQGGIIAGRALAEAGVTDACFLGVANPQTGVLHPVSALRLQGFELGLGQKLPPHRLIRFKSYCTSTGGRFAAQFVAMNPRPQGIFAVCDDMAIGAIMGLLAHGLVAGRDYQLVGFDGQARGQELETGPLTTVAVAPEEMGRIGAQMLFTRLEKPDQLPRTTLLGTQLLRGATVTHVGTLPSAGAIPGAGATPAS